MTSATTPTPQAQRLIDAAANRVATTALTGDFPDLTVDAAYDIQAEVVQARINQGSVVVGAKLGLTSAAKQKQMNVSEPLYGWLTNDMQIETAAPLVCSKFIQPRCEPEIAFILGEDLSGAHVSAVHVLAATQFVFAAVDVLDSRYAGYSFTLPDVAADNSSPPASPLVAWWSVLIHLICELSVAHSKRTVSWLPPPQELLSLAIRQRVLLGWSANWQRAAKVSRLAILCSPAP